MVHRQSAGRACPRFLRDSPWRVAGSGLAPGPVAGRLAAPLERTRWGAWLSQWSWRRSFRLILFRMAYFAIVGSYVATALWICGQGIAPATALAVIPLVLMATVLPSASGLGTRETALYLLLPSQRPDVLVAMGLIWSAGVIIVRLSIGLAWLLLVERHIFEGVAMSVESMLSVGMENCPPVVVGAPMPLVVALDRVKAEDVASVGGKGANLGTMLAAGLPVPPGFCVTTEAFRQFVSSCRDMEPLWAALRAIGPQQIDEAHALGERSASG